MPKRFWIDIVLILLLTVAIIFIAREWNGTSPQEDNSVFNPPSVSEAITDNRIRFRISFSDYNNIQNNQYRIEAVTESETIDLGSFEVRDVRIWNLDGSRIINNEFEVAQEPLSIRVYLITNQEEKVIYNKDITSDTELIAPADNNITSSLEYKIVK